MYFNALKKKKVRMVQRTDVKIEKVKKKKSTEKDEKRKKKVNMFSK